MSPTTGSSASEFANPPWGPYLSERILGTVREDDFSNGEVWNFLHDHARSRAYRWVEDGLAEISDEGNTDEFHSEYRVRSVSQYHRNHPYRYTTGGSTLRVDHEPSESRLRLLGGNSNWRALIWFPVNLLMIESLQKLNHHYGDEFKIECPTGSANLTTIDQVASELTNRLAKIFQKNNDANRPLNASIRSSSKMSIFRDYIPFHEYFDRHVGRAVGASHQTRCTGIIARLLQPSGGEQVPGPSAPERQENSEK